MRYPATMGMFVPTLAALIATAATTATAATPATATALGERAGQRGGSARSPSAPAPAVRYDGGSALNVTVSARIVRNSASIGPGLGPPVARMVARRTTFTAADGRAVSALVYDFE